MHLCLGVFGYWTYRPRSIDVDCFWCFCRSLPNQHVKGGKKVTEAFWGTVILAAVLFAAVEIMERCMGDEDG